MKRLARFFTLLLAAAVLAACMSLIAFAEDSAPSMAKESMTIRIGQLSSVELNDLPEGASVSYKSSNL